MFKLKVFKTFSFVVIGIWTFQFCFQSATAADSKSEEMDRILTKIFTNYKKEVHPKATRPDGSIGVGIGVNPIFIDIDEFSSVVNCHFWLEMLWGDDRLKWDYTEYSNVSRVHIAPDSIWKPDIKIFNSIQHEDFEDTDILIFSSGILYWVPPMTSHTTCSLDFTYWPWDVQKCNVTMGSWTRHGWEIFVHNMNRQNITDVSTQYFVPALWNIMSVKAIQNTIYLGDGEYTVPWNEVTIRFVISRSSSVDKKLSVLPLLVSACLSLAAFWTHPLSRNRMILVCINIFILIQTIIYIRSRLPRAGAQIPFVVSFAGSLLVLVTIQILVSLTMINLVSRLDDPPVWLVGPIKSIFGKILCISDLPLVGPIRSIDVEALQRTIDNSAVAPTNDSNAVVQTKFEISGWNLVAQAVDRIQFVLYLLIIFIFMGAYIGGAKSIIDYHSQK